MKKIITVILTLILLIAGLIFYLRQPGQISFNLYPINADVFQADQKVITNSAFAPGDYQFNVKAEGFISQTVDFKIKAARKNTLTAHLKQIPSPQIFLESLPLSVTLSSDKKNIIILNNQGTTVSQLPLLADPDNHRLLKPLTPELTSTISQIRFNPTNTSALVKHPNNWAIYDFNRFDLLNQKETLLPATINDPIYAPTNQKVAYISNAPGSPLQLIVTNPSFAQTEKTIDLSSHKSLQNLTWSKDETTIYFIDPTLGLFAIDLFKKTSTNPLNSKTLTNLKLSPSGNTLALEDNGQILLFNPQNQQTTKTNINAKLDDTIFDDQTEILYIPQAELESTEILGVGPSNNFIHYPYIAATSKLSPKLLLKVPSESQLIIQINNSLASLELAGN